MKSVSRVLEKNVYYTVIGRNVLLMFTRLTMNFDKGKKAIQWKTISTNNAGN